MRLLKKWVDPKLEKIDGKPYERLAARGIILDGDKILLLYTERYHDYSLPGGGIDDNEHIIEGLIREIEEETGAKNIEVLEGFGIYEEFRVSRYDGYDYIHLLSYNYICSCDNELGKANLEEYEIKNGMEARWVQIDEAISHNKDLIESSHDKMGISIHRETFLLESIKKEIIKKGW